MPSSRSISRKSLVEWYKKLPLRQIKKVAGGMILVLIGGVLLFAAGNYAFVRYRAHQQARRLNAVAADLQAVQNELLETLPNVREHSLDKSCGQSKSEYSGSVIWCGPVLYFLLDGISTSGTTIKDDVIEGILLKKRFASTDGSLQQARKEGIATITYNEVSCKIYADYFQTNQMYVYQSHRPDKNYQDGIYKVVVYCDEDSSIKLPGYVWR